MRQEPDPARSSRFALAPRDGVRRVLWLGGADFEADELVRRLSPAERAEREEVRGRLVEAMDFLAAKCGRTIRPEAV